MKFLRLLSFLLLLSAASYLAFTIFQEEQKKIQLKKDFIELSNIKYGLFNVDEWKVVLSDIIGKKVEDFKLQDANKEEMRKTISSFLYQEIDELEKRYYSQKSKSIVGILQGGVAAATGIFERIKKDVPVFAEHIINFLNKKENSKAIKTYLIKKLDEYADETFSKTDYNLLNQKIEKYQQSDLITTKKHLEENILQLESEGRPYRMLFLGIALISILLISLLKNIKAYELIMGLAISLVYLLVGVLLPMIEIDARIAELSFQFMGEEIQFYNQVLFYESKSILEVVQLMFAQHKIEMIAVGLLVLTFSVLFPAGKLISTAIYLQNKSSRKKSFIRFMVLKSSKWSMADVMVIAIFMAYIGFKGIISEQLRQLERLSRDIDLLSTNESNLLFGFFVFTLFVLLSLFTSQKIQNNFKA